MANTGLCPRFHRAIELVGGRWTGAILHLLMSGSTRFSELRNAIPEISDRMLSERLRVLEAEGLVVRTVIPETPVRIEYALTNKGHELQASLNARWAERWLPTEPGGRAPTPPSQRKMKKSPARRANEVSTR
ncbi:MAG: helix-turn-helix domain-containing protein [Acidobacteriota bacterium]